MSAEPVAVTPRAPGVEYFPSAIDPKIELFRCPSYRICLTAAACSKSWLKVQEAPKYGIHAERAACRSCPVGAAHARRPAVEPSRIADCPGLCLRCGHGTGGRLVGARLCISCYNRGAEVLRNANSRGNAPKLATHVEPMSIRFAIDGGKPRVWSVRQAADYAELALDLLRRHPSARLVFLPAERADLPEPAPGHSVICQCHVKQRAPVTFRCVALDRPIAGHAVGVVAENDPDWKAPKTARPHKQSAAPKAEPAPRAARVDAWPLIHDLRESDGKSCREIAEELNARGIRRPDGREWTDRMIRNRFKPPQSVPALQARPEAKPRPVLVLAPTEAVNAKVEASMIAAMIKGLRDCLLAA